MALFRNAIKKKEKFLSFNLSVTAALHLLLRLDFYYFLTIRCFYGIKTPVSGVLMLDVGDGIGESKVGSTKVTFLMFGSETCRGI